MYRARKPFAAAAFLFALAACSERPDTAASGAIDAAPPAEEAPAELVAASDAIVRAWNGESAEALAAFYAADAVVVVDDSTYEGRDGIRDRWMANALPVLSDLQLSGRTFSGSGDTRTETGRYTHALTMPDSAAITVTGSYDVTWLRQGDQWLVLREKIEQDTPAQ
jgi:ketosteroid isomerase-like protein